jgi:hypothetical protein
MTASLDQGTASVFQITKALARREVERHRGDLIGITASAPVFKDQNGLYEWVCDVRIGVRENQGLVKDVLIAQEATGVVNDLNIPVLMQRDDAGRLTIYSRAAVRLPDVSLTTYSYAELGFLFMSNLIEQDDGTYLDGYGYPMSNPESEIGVGQTWSWVQQTFSLDDLDEEGDIDEVTAHWEVS